MYPSMYTATISDIILILVFLYYINLRVALCRYNPSSLGNTTIHLGSMCFFKKKQYPLGYNLLKIPWIFLKKNSIRKDTIF